MSERTSISIDDDLYAELAERKGDDESWTDCLRRLTTDETDSQRDGRTMDALTEEHISDIAAATARRTADELETRLR